MCWKCGNPIEQGILISRTTECPVCNADLHSCKNCRFYESGAHYDCHESIEDPVSDKEKANFCDYFSVKTSFSSTSKSSSSSKAALDAFNSLFGSLICL